MHIFKPTFPLISQKVYKPKFLLSEALYQFIYLYYIYWLDLINNYINNLK
jgi:hypothetical protein